MGHTYFTLLVHVIFSTKDRAPTIGPDLRLRLHEYMGGLANEEIGRSIRIGGTENHIHGLLLIRPNISVSDAMAKWKSLSSGWINKLDNRVGQPRFSWQAGYGAFSVSQSNSPSVVRYIERQMEHHQHQTYEAEYLEFLRRHEVDFDPATIWE